MGMKNRYEFNEVTLLSAIAMGAPGKRTFFLMMGHKDEWIRVWLEKEHVQVIVLAIEQLLEKLSQEYPDFLHREEKMSFSDDVSSRLPIAELEVDQITLGFDRERVTLNLLVHPAGPQGAEQAEVSCRATLAQVKNISDQAKSICAAGRPRCEICGRPIDPTGHTCPGRN
ncbi:DUF3090 family protein [Chloroflexota bacterium]